MSHLFNFSSGLRNQSQQLCLISSEGKRIAVKRSPGTIPEPELLRTNHHARAEGLSILYCEHQVAVSVTSFMLTRPMMHDKEFENLERLHLNIDMMQYLL
jgi:hypothetical protein